MIKELNRFVDRLHLIFKFDTQLAYIMQICVVVQSSLYLNLMTMLVMLCWYGLQHFICSTRYIFTHNFTSYFVLIRYFITIPKGSIRSKGQSLIKIKTVISTKYYFFININIFFCGFNTVVIFLNEGVVVNPKNIQA